MFKEVSKSNRCQICHKSNWCTYSPCGQYKICRRINDGTAKIKINKNGEEYYVYRK